MALILFGGCVHIYRYLVFEGADSYANNLSPWVASAGSPVAGDLCVTDLTWFY